jgi:hypothetical protein
MQNHKELQNLPLIKKISFSDTEVFIVANQKKDMMKVYFVSPREQKWLGDWVRYSNENLTELLSEFKKVIDEKKREDSGAYKTQKSRSAGGRKRRFF